jgi:hypothetical protein
MLEWETMLFFIQTKSTFQKKKNENYFKVYWKMSFDGACSKSGNGAGIIFKIPEIVIHPHVVILEFPCTNNEVEYEALIKGMIISLQIKF